MKESIINLLIITKLLFYRVQLVHKKESCQYEFSTPISSVLHTIYDLSSVFFEIIKNLTHISNFL